MQRQEFNQFCKSLFSQFPGLYKWLQDASPDLNGTLNHWEKILEPITLAEAMGVLADFTEGRKNPPEAYEREHFARVIRQMVFLDRDRVAKQQHVASERERYDRANYQPAAFGIPEVAKAYKEGRVIRQAFVEGQIDQEEYDFRIDNLMRRCGV